MGEGRSCPASVPAFTQVGVCRKLILDTAITPLVVSNYSNCQLAMRDPISQTRPSKDYECQIGERQGENRAVAQHRPTTKMYSIFLRHMLEQ